MPQQQFVCVLAGWLDKQRNSWPRRWQRRYFAVVAERASRVAVMYYYARGPATGGAAGGGSGVRAAQGAAHADPSAASAAPEEAFKGCVRLNNLRFTEAPEGGECVIEFAAYQQNKTRERPYRLRAGDAQEAARWRRALEDAQAGRSLAAGEGGKAAEAVGAKFYRTLSMGATDGEATNGNAEEQVAEQVAVDAVEAAVRPHARRAPVCDTDELEAADDLSSMDDGGASGGMRLKKSIAMLKKRNSVVGTHFGEEKDAETLRYLSLTMLEQPELTNWLTRAQADAVAAEMDLIKAPPGHRLYVPGDTCKHFYVLESGELEASLDGGATWHALPGRTYGVDALSMRYTVEGEVRARGDCRIWVVERLLWKMLVKHVQNVQKRELSGFLENLPLLEGLSERQRRAFAAALQLQSIKQGDDIVVQGEAGASFYIVLSGTVDVVKDGEKVSELQPGAYFGERALLEEERRAATCLAATNVEVLVLDRESFTLMLGPLEEALRRAIRETSASKVPIFQSLSDDEVAMVVNRMWTRNVTDGETVFMKGDVGEYFYIVEKGSVRVHLSESGEGQQDVVLREGDFFGEQALLKKHSKSKEERTKLKGGRRASRGSVTEAGGLRNQTVSAVGATVLGVLDAKTFADVLGPLDVILAKSNARHRDNAVAALRGVDLLKDIGAKEMRKLVETIEVCEYHKGETLIKAGTRNGTFYVLEKGSVDVYTKGIEDDSGDMFKVKTLGEGAAFGETAFMADDDVETNASIVTASDCRMLELDGTRARELLGTAAGALESRANDRRATWRIKVDTKVLPPAPPADGVPATLDGLTIGKTLGCGTFGRVRLVNANGKYWALKVMKKQQVIQQAQQKHVLDEKLCMQAMRGHPYLLRLGATYQDPKSLYMLLEFLQGGELFALLSRRNRLPQKEANFYLASYALGLSAMHSKGYVYRDIKPENTLIDSDGFIRIVDYGFCKKLAPGETTSTMCGTPDYLAPEILRNTGHNFTADWWAFGILVYEVLNGIPPFARDNPTQTYRAIKDFATNPTKHPIKWPKHFSAEAMDLCSKLLVPNQQLRLGALAGGVDDIKNHPFFAGVNWSRLAKKDATPPWVPEVKHQEDLSLFEDEYPSSDDEPAEAYDPTFDSF